jgi:drug/metabolite transporter (DMT)-like permease
LEKIARNNLALYNWGLLIVLSLIWGSSFILIKKSLTVFQFDQVGALRVVFAFFVMLPIGLVHMRKIPKEKWKYIFVMGMLGNMVPAFLFAKAQTQLPSSLTGVLNALTPLITSLIAVVSFGYQIKKIQVAGLVIAFLGSASLSIVGDSGEWTSFNIYVLFVVLAAVCYATSTNVIKAHLTQIRSLPLTASAVMMVGPFALFYVISTPLAESIGADPPKAYQALGYLAILGIMGTAFALILFNKLLQNTTAVFASSVTYLIPLVAIMWGIFDGEKLFLAHYAGIAAIMVGVFIANRP